MRVKDRRYVSLMIGNRMGSYEIPADSAFAITDLFGSKRVYVTEDSSEFIVDLANLILDHCWGLSVEKYHRWAEQRVEEVDLYINNKIEGKEIYGKMYSAADIIAALQPDKYLQLAFDYLVEIIKGYIHDLENGIVITLCDDYVIAKI